MNHLNYFIGVIFVFFFSQSVYADNYQVGRGFTINDTLTLGGYISTEFESKAHEDNSATLDDVAILAYGSINPMLSYLVELEAPGFYSKNLKNGEEDGSQKFHIERLYADVWMADAFNFRIGKQITPIGYWNTEPINVLRDTTSNPLHTKLMFPKFLTGVDMYGYVPKISGLQYHFFAQKNHDFDKEYINLPNTHFFGAVFEQELDMDASAGAGIGDFFTVDHIKNRFVQLNFKFDDGTFQLMTEGMIANKNDGVRQANSKAGYLQALYRFNSEHAIVSRLEYYNDRYRNYKDEIFITGYSYRPIYPVSLKGEYQWHSQRDENKFLFSFSVLF